MKKILFLFLLFAASCQNEAVEIDDTTEINDANAETQSELVSIQNEGFGERAIKITSASASNIVGTNAECDKYKGQAKLKTGTGADGTEFTLRGVEFGATQGAKVAQVEIPSGKAAPVAVTIVSWSDTEIKLKIPKVAETTKNITIKIRLIDSLRTTTASFKSVGWFEAENIWFGHNRWDFMQTAELRALYATLGNNKVAIAAGYVPAINDLLLENGTGQMGIVTNTKIILSGLNKGKTEVTVAIRNGTCKGTVSKKKYLLHIGTLVITNPADGYASAFTHYLN